MPSYVASVAVALSRESTKGFSSCSTALDLQDVEYLDFGDVWSLEQSRHPA